MPFQEFDIEAQEILSLDQKIKIPFIFFLILSNLILPIVELSFQGLFGSQISCSPKLISLRDWIIVDAVLSLFTLFISSIESYSKNRLFESMRRYIITVNIRIFMNILFFIWLVLGSIIFWGDCKDQPPEEINTLMYLVLIIGYLKVYLNILLQK